MSVATQVPNTTPAMGLTATVFDEGAVTVEIVWAFAGADGTMLRAAAGQLDGVVIAGTGGGQQLLDLVEVQRVGQLAAQLRGFDGLGWVGGEHVFHDQELVKGPDAR